MKPLVMRDYDKAVLDKRIAEAEKRGWTLKDRGKTFQGSGYSVFWAKLERDFDR